MEMEMKEKKELVMQLFDITQEIKLVKGNIKTSNNLIEMLKSKEDGAELLDTTLEKLVAQTSKFNSLKGFAGELKKELKNI